MAYIHSLTRGWSCCSSSHWGTRTLADELSLQDRTTQADNPMDPPSALDSRTSLGRDHSLFGPPQIGTFPQGRVPAAHAQPNRNAHESMVLSMWHLPLDNRNRDRIPEMGQSFLARGIGTLGRTDCSLTLGSRPLHPIASQGDMEAGYLFLLGNTAQVCSCHHHPPWDQGLEQATSPRRSNSALPSKRQWAKPSGR